MRENLNLANFEFFIKKKIGLSTYGMERYFKLIDTDENNIIIPRGFLDELTNFLNENEISFEIEDKRSKHNLIDFKSSLKLFDYQKEALDSMLLSENGVLVAPPGSGKTIIGIELISKLQRPALILVHKKQIFNQWIERIESFLGIPKKDIGQLYANKKKVGDKITVAMVQTLNKIPNIDELTNKFGLIIVDECHHVPAKIFRNVITKLNPYYLYGLTATPERKHGDEKLIFIFLGNIIHTINKNFREQENPKTKNTSRTNIIIKNTNIEIPFKIKTDDFQILSKIISFDSNRNKQIVEDIITETNKDSKCLVLTERKEHVDILSYYLKREFEIITLTGDLTEKQRKEKMKQIEDNNFQIIIATGQLIGEGTDLPALNCLFLVFPFSFHGKLIQYIGRIQRGLNQNSTIYDYRDIKIEYLEKLFKKRMDYYKKNCEL